MVSPSADSAEILPKENSVNFAWIANGIDQKFLWLKSPARFMLLNEPADIEDSITYFSGSSLRLTAWGLPTSV